METLNLNGRVDANDKKRFEEFCNTVGMNVSTAINIFIKAVLIEQKLPFEISTNTFDELINDKLKEADMEMDRTTKRCSEEEILKIINNTLNS